MANDCGCSGGCSCGSCEDLNLLMGEPGTPGARGGWGGNSQPYLFDTQTTSTPAATYLGFNASNLTAATAMYVNIADRNNAGLTTWLAGLGASTNSVKSNIRVWLEEDSKKFADFNVTAVSLSSGVYTVTIVNTAVSSNSPFILDDKIILSYDRVGDVGANGTNGTNSVIIKDNIIDDVPAIVTNTSGTPTTFGASGDYQFAAGDIANNGDEVNIEILFVCSDSDAAANNIFGYFQIDNSYSYTYSTPSFFFSGEYMLIRASISRKNATTGLIKVELVDSTGFVLTDYSISSGFDFDNTALDIKLFGSTDVTVGVGASYIKPQHFYINYIPSV